MPIWNTDNIPYCNIFLQPLGWEKFVTAYINKTNMTVNYIKQLVPLEYIYMTILYHKHPT